MTYLTITGTAVLVPSTLATIFSNSAFDLESSDIGWYMALLVVPTVVVTVIVYWWVKRQSWIPRKWAEGEADSSNGIRHIRLWPDAGSR